MRLKFYILLIPVLVWLVFLIILPHLYLFISSFEVQNDAGEAIFSLDNYKIFFEDEIYWNTFIHTLTYSIAITFLTFLVSFPVAFYLTKVVSRKYASFLTLLLLIPLWVGELVPIYGWMIILGDKGVVNEFLLKIGVIDKPLHLLYNDFSMIVGFLYMAVLFMIVPIMSVLESLDDSLIEAASDLGASKWDIFTKIIIPYSMPGIVSGSIIVFMLIIGDYIVPNILGGKSSLWFTEQIYDSFLSTFNWNEGAAFGFLLLIVSMSVVWIALKLTKQKLKA